MLRTHAAFEGVGAADSISLDCAFLMRGVNPLGVETMLISFAARVGCGDPWGFNGSKHGVWLLWVVSPGALWSVRTETMLSRFATFGGLVPPLVYLQQRVC